MPQRRQGCLPGNVSASLPFCDRALSTEKRLDDLVGRLSLQEKIGLMSADSHTHVSSCANSLYLFYICFLIFVYSSLFLVLLLVFIFVYFVFVSSCAKTHSSPAASPLV
eukprot:SAG31_NODE_10291_length_1159_cov_1.276415_2_plen_108_part_01